MIGHSRHQNKNDLSLRYQNQENWLLVYQDRMIGHGNVKRIISDSVT